MFKEKMKNVKFREDLPFLLNDLGLTGMGAEIGIQMGIFSNHLLTHWKGKKLYLIDAWRQFKEGYEDLGNVDHNGHLDCLARTFMATYHFGERATIIRELSLEATSLFKDESLDFVFLDANHSYEAVKEDLHAWFPKVKTGGIFCGHDYVDSSFEENGVVEFGVKGAVDDFSKEVGLEVFQTNTGIKSIKNCQPLENWFIQKV